MLIGRNMLSVAPIIYLFCRRISVSLLCTSLEHVEMLSLKFKRFNHFHHQGKWIYGITSQKMVIAYGVVKIMCTVSGSRPPRRMGERCYSPTHSYLGSRWRWMVAFYIPVALQSENWRPLPICRCSGKSLSRPGRKQNNVSVRMG